MEKTIKQWIEILPDPYKTKALDNSNSYLIETLSCACMYLHDAIHGAFLWDDTPEGHDYWQDVANRASNGDFA